MPADWFRSSSWDAGDREFFETKLARARRTSRAQYVRIQAFHLAESRDANAREAAGGLYRRVIDGYPDDAHEVAKAWAELAEWHRGRGELHDAIAAARNAVAREDALGNLDWGSGIELAELLVEVGEHPDEAQRMLDRAHANRLVFQASRWRWSVASARLALRSGDRARARRHAASALEELADDRPDFGRHPDVGRAATDRATMDEMRAIAAG